jgi:hypothetical protein
MYLGKKHKVVILPWIIYPISMGKQALYRIFLWLLLLFGALAPAVAQSPQNISDKTSKFLIYFLDKGSHNPFPSSPSLQQKWENQEIYEPYLDTLKSMGFSIDLKLRWQNAVSGWCTTSSSEKPCTPKLFSAQSFVSKIRILPRKKSLEEIPPLLKPLFSQKEALSSTLAVEEQTELYQSLGLLSFLRQGDANWIPQPGTGLKVAVIDDGFSLGHQAFLSFQNAVQNPDSLPNKILDQKDFVDTTASPISLQLGNSHGAKVLSLLAGKQHSDHSLTGVVPYAQFLLYRAEKASSESPVEEDYVAAAIERAVEKGANVINISLGYRYDFSDSTYTEHPYSYLDGTHSPASVAALQAARRNTLVVVSMGNENWSHPGTANITVPADADSILSVGAGFLNEGSYFPCGFSSRGPTFDGRIKPEVSAPGCAVPVIHSTVDSLWELGQGTSFSAPIVAGMAALLWQLFPNQTAQDIRTALIESGNNHMTPNDSIGHGLVNMERAYQYLLKQNKAENPSTLQSHSIRYVLSSQNQSQLFGTIGKLSPSWDVYNTQGKQLFSIPTQGKVIGEEVWHKPPSNVSSGPVLIRVR